MLSLVCLLDHIFILVVSFSVSKVIFVVVFILIELSTLVNLLYVNKKSTYFM